MTPDRCKQFFFISVIVISLFISLSFLSAPSLSAQETATTSVPTFSRTLRAGLRGTDVKVLQRFLNSIGFAVSEKGPGSFGYETEFFGAGTYKAVNQFQERFATYILAPLGLTSPTGIFGQASKKVAAELTVNIPNIEVELSAPYGDPSTVATSDEDLPKQNSETKAPSVSQQSLGSWVITPVQEVATTSAPVPALVSVTTLPATSISSDSATFHGSLSITDSNTASSRGFTYGSNPNLSTSTIATTETSGAPFGTGAYSTTITGFSCGTTYYVQAYAINVAGTATGTVQSFTTSPCLITYSVDNLTSPLGTNLSGITYYSGSRPFLDEFKQSTSQWYTHSTSTWDTLEQAKLNVDADGWVKSLTPKDGQSASFSSIGRYVLNGRNAQYPGGTWIVLYEGEGTITYTSDAVKKVASSTPGRDVLTVTPTGNGFLVKITAIDPNNTGNYLRNIRIVREKDEAALLAGEIFAPEFLELTKRFKVLRFMDWMVTNGSLASEWSTRPMSSSISYGTNSTYTTGVSVEIMIALSNKLHSDPWFNMPHMATDDYITQFASTTHALLESGRKVYVEYSNETWNSGFAQTAYVQNQGLALWPNQSATPWVAGWNYTGMRGAQMCDIWKAVWGADAGRVVCVLGTQAAGYGGGSVTSTNLACPLWTASGGSCAQHFDALAIAPYFGSDGSLDNAAYGWATSSATSTTITNIINALSTTYMPQSFTWMSEQKRLADQYGLDLISYEGGQHLVDEANRQPLVDIYIEANRDPRMGELYTIFLNKWKELGGKLFAHFSDIAGSSRYGSWGALESIIATSSPKFDALMDFITDNPCWWSGCMPDGTPDTYAPVVYLTSPSVATTTASTSMNLAANVYDAGSIAGVTFYADGTSIGSEDVSSPYQAIWDLIPVADGTHSVVAVARDTVGNYATSTAVTVTVAGAPPLFSSISSGVATTTSTTITWTTNKPATSQIFYGTTSAYGFATAQDAAFVTSHSVTLTGLATSTLYHYQIVSTDQAGHTATSTDLLFTTSDVTPTPVLTYVGSGAFTVSTSTLSATDVNFGTPYTSRRIIIAMGYTLPSGRIIASSTIGGISGTTHFSQIGPSTSWTGMISALVPTGTTGTVAINFNQQCFCSGRYAIYTVDNNTLISSTPTVATSSVNASSTSVSISETLNGFTIGVVGFNNGGGKGVMTVSSPFSLNAAAANYMFFSKQGNTATTVTTASTSWTGPYDVSMGVATWR